MRTDCDSIARALAAAGRIGRALPPAWDGDRITSLVAGPQGQYVGKILPGRGLLLGMDPWTVGLTRLPPHVYGVSDVLRLVETFELQKRRAGLEAVAAPQASRLGRNLCPERLAIRTLDRVQRRLRFSPTTEVVRQIAAAITSYDGIIAGRAGGKAGDVVFLKTSFTTVANTWFSTYRAGGFPTAGSYTNIPGGAAHDRSSAGALSQGLSNPTNPDKTYLLSLGFDSTSAINWMLLLDVLVACGNISASITTSQTINSTAQTRQYGSSLGAGVLAIMEVTTALGTGTGTSSLTSYTDQGGTAAQVSGAGTSVASSIAQRLFPDTLLTYPLAAGDFGVRSVESFAFSGAHTAGVVALILYFPLAFIPGVAANLYAKQDSTTNIDGLIELVQTAGGVLGCLALHVNANTTSLGTLTGQIQTVAG